MPLVGHSVLPTTTATATAAASPSAPPPASSLPVAVRAWRHCQQRCRLTSTIATGTTVVTIVTTGTITTTGIIITIVIKSWLFRSLRSGHAAADGQRLCSAGPAIAAASGKLCVGTGDVRGR